MFLVHFLEYLLLFLDDNADEESEKISYNLASGCCLLFCFIFSQSQPGVAYKSVTNRKERVIYECIKCHFKQLKTNALFGAKQQQICIIPVSKAV